MTNVMKTRRSAEGKIIAFELYYQGQITGLIPKYSFPQGLPFCSMRCQSKQLALKYRIRHGRFSNTQILRCWNIHCCSFFNKVRWLQESPHSFMHVQPQILLVYESDIITLVFFFFCKVLLKSATYCVFLHFFNFFFFTLPLLQKVIYSFYSSYFGRALPVAHSVLVTTSCLLGELCGIEKKKTQTLSRHMTTKVQTTDVYMYGKRFIFNASSHVGSS